MCFCSSIDDVITPDEMSYAAKQMKKGGCDYSLSVLTLLMAGIPACYVYCT